MKMKILRQTLSCVALAGVVGVASADVLELRDGTIHNGVLIGATGDTLYLRADGQVKLVNIGEVGSIRFDRRPLAQSGRGSGDPAHDRAVIVAAGALIVVALPKNVAQGAVADGDRFTAHLSQDFRSGDVVISAAGSKVYAQVVSHPLGGLAMTLTDLTVEGDRLPIKTRSRPLPLGGGDTDMMLEFRVERPFTLRLASN